MSLLNRGKLEIKLGEFAIGQTPALTDASFVVRAQDYRRHTAARMIPLETEDILTRLPPSEYHVSLKVDGEFNLLVYADGESLLVNPGGTVRVGLPLLKEAVALFKKAGVKKAILAGELHYEHAQGKRGRVHDVSRVARQPSTLEELNDLGFAAFDIVEVDGARATDGFEPTWKRLTGLFAGGKHCTVVESVWLKDAVDIEAQFRNWVEQGAEGAVVRSDAIGMFKLKPRHSIDVAVIGFTEGTDDRAGMVHDLLIALMRADGCLHVLGHVGGGFSIEERRGFLSDLKDMMAKSDYVEVNDNVAYHMVRPEWVIEISVLEVISHNTRGMPIKKMALHWNAAEKRYQIVRRLPLANLISPQFIRRREDKSVNPIDVRMEQVSDVVEVPLVDRDARQLNLPPSQLLRREVCTKQLKGQTMVRKLLLWQTNKARDTDDFPAYVIHYTDYSPNRKTPLERDVRVSSSRAQIEELWRELAAEAFAKGWTPVGVGAAPGEKQDAAAGESAEALAAAPPKKRGKKAQTAEESAANSATADEAPAKPAAKKRASAKTETPGEPTP
jgi:hypothetical protein